MGEWQTIAFERLLAEPVRNGIYKPKEFHGSGAKIVNMGELFGHPRLRAIPMKRLKLNESEAQRFELQSGDLLFARRSLVAEGAGKCSIVLEVDEPTTFESSIIRARPDKRKTDPLFLYYFFNSPNGFYLLDTIRRQVAVAGITGSDLSQLTVPVPSLDDQHNIASLLGALDDKIELNRQMNETLEATARLFFKDWFVDFGPTRAKAEGRPPYLAPDLWALFPDALDDDDKPMGWEYHPFGFLLSDSIGGDWGKDLPGNDHVEQVAIIRGTDVPDITAGGTGKVPIRYTTKKKLDSRILRDGDMVIEVSGGSPTQPTGRSLFISQSILDRFAVPVVCASFCRRFRPRSLQTGIFAAQHLSFLYEIGGTWEYQNQSTGISNFQTTHFLEAEKIAWPGDKIIDAFAKVVEPLIRLSTRNENCALIQTRDLLLPKLMSGEIRLRDAEKLVEQVA